MNEPIIRRVETSAELDKWRLFYQTTKGGFFQSPVYYHFCQQTEGLIPLLFAAYRNNVMEGSLLVAIHSNGKGPKSILSRRAICIEGPVTDNNNSMADLIAPLLSCINQALKGKAIYTEFRNHFDVSAFKPAFYNEGFTYQAHLNIQLPIYDVEESLQKIGSSKRRQISKSLKAGAKIIEAQNLDQVRVFYEILAGLYQQKVKKPLPAYSFFSTLFTDTSLRKHVKYLLVELEGKILGGILAPVYEQTIYEWYIAHVQSDNKSVYPGVMATWAAIKYGAENKLAYFDFLGAGKPDEDYGVRDFKLQFGGELVEHGRFIRINQPVLFSLGKIGLKLLNSLKK